MSDTSTALVHQPQRAETALEPRDAREAMWLAQQLAPSGMTGRVRTPEAVLAVLLTGRELGLTAMQSLRSIHIIDGRPTLSADLMVALCKRSPLCKFFRLVESSGQVATYETERAGEGVTRMSYTLDEAKAAGLATRDNWKKFTAAMLRARCSSALARSVYPDLLVGIYETDEIVEAGSPRIVDAEVVQPLVREATTRAPAGRVAPQSIAQAVEEHTAHAATAEPQLTPADIAASVAAAPEATPESAPEGLELRPAGANDEPPAPSLSPEEMEQLDCDNLSTEMMAAKDLPSLNEIATRAAQRFPDKGHKYRQLLAKTVYPRAKAKIEAAMGQAA